MLTLSQCNNRFDKLQEKQNLKQFQHIKINENETLIYTSDKNKIYIPSPTGKLFHEDTSFVKCVMGPYGSGKSTMCINHIVQQACKMPAWFRGRRKSRWAIVRNTSGELQSTTLQTWLAWFSDLGDINKRQKPLMTYEHTFNDGNGIVELELIFIALDREDDVRKIKSLEVTGAYINELSEVPQGALSHFKGRVNHRYPSRAFCDEPYWSGIICDTNPPDTDHWIHKDFEEKTLESYRMFKQPPGLIYDNDKKMHRNPSADNANNLASDYYLKLAEGQTEQFVNVFCMGQYGSVGFGKRVYPEYNDDIHSVDHIDAIQGDPIDLSWDFGLTPACIVSQLSPRGQLRVLKEYCGENIGIRTFAQNVVIPALERDFPYCKIGLSDADPSGIKGDEIMEELSCIGELNSLGIKTVGANTNDIQVRISSVRYFLNTMIDGKPAFLLSRKGAPTLRKGFIRDYCMKRIAVAGEERYHDKPDKNMSSHTQDALQYRAMRYAADRILESKADNSPKVDMFNPVMRIF